MHVFNKGKCLSVEVKMGSGLGKNTGKVDFSHTHIGVMPSIQAFTHTLVPFIHAFTCEPHIGRCFNIFTAIIIDRCELLTFSVAIVSTTLQGDECFAYIVFQ